MNSMGNGLSDKLLPSGKHLETGLNIFAAPNIIELKIYIEVKSKLTTRRPIWNCNNESQLLMAWDTGHPAYIDTG